jgi:hypothetical protein
MDTAGRWPESGPNLAAVDITPDMATVDCPPHDRQPPAAPPRPREGTARRPLVAHGRSPKSGQGDAPEPFVHMLMGQNPCSVAGGNVYPWAAARRGSYGPPRASEGI